MRFLKGLGLWLRLAIPSTYANSMVRLILLHDLCLSSFPYLRYYRSGLDGVDQYITADVEAWSDPLSGL